MTINRIIDTPVEVNLYNARAITVNNCVTKNCVRQADGTLWVLASDHAGDTSLYRSTDNGFSWSVAIEGVESGLNMREQAGFNADGFFGYIVINERYRLLDIIMGEYESIAPTSSVERGRYNLDDLTEAVTNTTILDAADDPAEGMFDVCSNDEQAFLVWVAKVDGDLKVTRLSPRSVSVSGEVVHTTTGFAMLSSVCDKNGKVHIAFGWLDGANRKLSFITYDSTTPSFGAEVLIENMGASPALAADIAIALDGLGNLCVIYYDRGDQRVRYATSIDDGATWDVNTLTITAGHARYTDSITSDNAGRTNIIGGSKGGFILTYVEDNSDGTPRAYVRQLTTDDSGATYDLQAEKEVATAAPWTTEKITGVQFFHPTDIKLLDLTDPGHTRIAFTVGEGDSLTMADTIPISVGQELLFNSAYPTSLASETGSYTLDTADSLSLRATVNILGTPGSNLDFSAAGMTGTFTERYTKAFELIGTAIRLLRYEPDSANFLSDKSAYGAPTESETFALFDPVTYSFPSPALSRSVSIERVEQDVRKLHLPASQHLARTFVVNQSGFLKRTVWLCEYDGNQYEISQVVPRFISNQICYYECNAYVVGPSRDPFSRTVLPSET